MWRDRVASAWIKCVIRLQQWIDYSRRSLGVTSDVLNYECVGVCIVFSGINQKIFKKIQIAYFKN